MKIIKDNSQTVNKLGFAFYDFSNSGYVLIFQTFLMPIFLGGLIKENSFKIGEIWGWAVSSSVLLAIIISPLLGRFTDIKNKTIPFAILVVLVSLLAIFSILFVNDDFILMIMIFVLFNSMFELTQTLYNSFLPLIAKSAKEINRLSTFAWGFGYLGGIIFSIIYLVLNQFGFSSKVILLVCAYTYLLFSIFPIIVFWKVETKTKSDFSESKKSLSFKKLFNTHIPINLKQLLVYWIIADCIAAIMYHSSLFSRTELNIPERTIGMLMLATQLFAFPFTWYSGNLANKYGLNKIIRLSLYIWFIILILLFFSTGIKYLIIVLLLTSMVIGSTQSLLRAHFSNRIEKDISGEGFGFFEVANKTASLISPAIIATIVSITGSIRPAFLFLSILVILSIYLMKYLRDNAIINN